MVHISYVYPNVSEIAQRGGLLERWQLAKGLGCEYIEVPADLVKNKTEVKKTGLDLCDFLTDEAIDTIYDKEYNNPKESKYIFHTEPSLRRNDGYGMSYQAPLKWHDQDWVEKFVNMVIAISRFFGIPANIIEIHPGYKKNSFDGLIISIEFLLDRYNEEFGVEPLILIENRTGQFISSGKEILSFWMTLSENYPDLRRKIGVVLDIQQLYTVTKRKFLSELELIPLDVLKGFHIHYRHRVPDISNEIPWIHVFNLIAEIEDDLLINPEIHHKNRVGEAIRFCEGMLG